MLQNHTKVIACATVVEEMLPLLPPSVAYDVLDFGLHVDPQALKRSLQNAVDASAPEAETIILGYGLCSQAAIGLRATDCTLLALINTGQYELEGYRDYARRTAARFGLRYEEIAGSTALIQEMIHGPWDEEFVVVPRGQVIRHEDFFPVTEPNRTRCPASEDHR